MSPGPEDLLSQREKREVIENDRRVREQAKTRQWRYRERQPHCWASYWGDADGAVLDMLIRRKCKMGAAIKAKWTKSEGSPSATA